MKNFVRSVCTFFWGKDSIHSFFRFSKGSKPQSCEEHSEVLRIPHCDWDRPLIGAVTPARVVPFEDFGWPLAWKWITQAIPSQNEVIRRESRSTINSGKNRNGEGLSPFYFWKQMHPSQMLINSHDPGEGS